MYIPFNGTHLYYFLLINVNHVIPYCSLPHIIMNYVTIVGSVAALQRDPPRD